MKSVLITAALVSLFAGLLTGARAEAANQCSDLFSTNPSKALAEATTVALGEAAVQKIRLLENFPPYVSRFRTNYDQILFLTELASISNRTQGEVATVVESVPSISFGRTTSYAMRLRIATLSVLSGKSVEETMAMMSSVPRVIRGFVSGQETFDQIVNLAAATGRAPIEIAKVIENIPDISFGSTTSWSFRLWLAKIGIMGNHRDYAETESLIRSVPRFLFNRRMSPDTLTAIVELSVVSGKSAPDVVKVIESVPNVTWGRTTTFENRMWIAKLSVLSGHTPLEIETMGNLFPNYILRHATTGAQKRFVMSLIAVGQNKKAFEMIDRPMAPEVEIGFWEALTRYLFE